MTRLRAFALASVLGMVGVSARAQARPDSAVRLPPYRGRLLGVYDATTGDPIAGVAVTDMLTGLAALTTRTGTVSLAFVRDGGSLVSIKKVGYGPQTMTVPINAQDTVPITVVLERVAELPTVVVKTDPSVHYLSPALRGFEERRKNAASGYFIDEQTLRKEDGRPLGNVLVAHVPGAQVQQARGNANFLLKSPRCVNGGQPDVYLDGVPLAHTPDPRWTGTTQITALGGGARPRRGGAGTDPREA
jgi:hypothetical protein